MSAGHGRSGDRGTGGNESWKSGAAASLSEDISFRAGQLDGIQRVHVALGDERQFEEYFKAAAHVADPDEVAKMPAWEQMAWVIRYIHATVRAQL